MKKTFRKMSVALAAVMAVAATSMLPAHAANTDNCDWSCNNNAFVGYERKTDDSSIYIKNSTSTPVTVSVYGASAANTQTYSVSTCSKYNEVLKTTGLYLPGNCRRLIRQYIKENNYSYAMLYVYGTSNGAWSPDSYGTYEKLN